MGWYPEAKQRSGAGMSGRLREPRGQPGYLSYLLRLWQVDHQGITHQEGGTLWRASVESSLTGERQGFASLEELFEFLHRQMVAANGADERQNWTDQHR
jgi:hypothetical protein